MCYYILHAPTDSVLPPAFVLEGSTPINILCGSFFSALQFGNYTEARNFINNSPVLKESVIFKKEF